MLTRDHLAHISWCTAPSTLAQSIFCTYNELHKMITSSHFIPDLCVYKKHVVVYSYNRSERETVGVVMLAGLLCWLLSLPVLARAEGEQAGVARAGLAWAVAGCRGRFSGQTDQQGRPAGFGTLACSGGATYTGHTQAQSRHVP